MKTPNTKRRIVETAVGAALGAAIAGPAGAIAGGLAGNQAASRVGNLGARRRARKKSKPAAKTAMVNANLRRILVPVDFSGHSLGAVRVARDWARRFQAEVCLLHIVEPMITAAPFGAQAMILPSPPPDFRSHAQVSLDKLLQEEFPRSRNVTALIREGVPYDAIVAAARKLKSDLIVISTHGRTGLMRVLMGSTAERVVRHAPCPVLTIRSA